MIPVNELVDNVNGFNELKTSSVWHQSVGTCGFPKYFALTFPVRVALNRRLTHGTSKLTVETCSIGNSMVTVNGAYERKS